MRLQEPHSVGLEDEGSASCMAQAGPVLASNHGFLLDMTYSSVTNYP